jgi:hypothetical protein
LAAEEALNRQFRLEVETLRAPKRIEMYATQDLHMTPATAATTLVIDVPAKGTPTAKPATVQHEAGIR